MAQKFAPEGTISTDFLNSTPGAEAVKTSEILEYQVRAAEEYGNLLPLELKGVNLFLSN